MDIRTIVIEWVNRQMLSELRDRQDTPNPGADAGNLR